MLEWNFSGSILTQAYFAVFESSLFRPEFVFVNKLFGHRATNCGILRALKICSAVVTAS
jgi:hypothetical protein